jgi:hypothetical protein
MSLPSKSRSDDYLGGPGGSGVGQILRGGYAVRTVLSAGTDADNGRAKVRPIPGIVLSRFFTSRSLTIGS